MTFSLLAAWHYIALLGHFSIADLDVNQFLDVLDILLRFDFNANAAAFRIFSRILQLILCGFRQITAINRGYRFVAEYKSQPKISRQRGEEKQIAFLE